MQGRWGRSHQEHEHSIKNTEPRHDILLEHGIVASRSHSLQLNRALHSFNCTARQFSELGFIQLIRFHFFTMKYTASLLLLSNSLVYADKLPQNSDSAVAAAWEKSGSCAYFYEKPGAWKSLAETCVKYCEAQPDGHGYSECDHTPYKDMDLPEGAKSIIATDDAGDAYVPCKCKCSNPDVEGIAKELVDVVVEGLSHLDEFLCGIFMTAMVTVVEIGIDAIPGGAEATAAARAVQGVKSFVENGLDIADSMGNWVGKVCGIEDPNWPNSLFDILLAAPDS